ncbi:hypothetical protein [Halobacteriovorax sp. JY17]|uniref:hypothetical protein n=1 Tax=Halobacteriovorax sp. JY17 TaxID=2014617 RepID=UPI000C44F32E|nr:hypothetical protein [Halobacteriovorax sp. JY17]PIK16277.1 MAG: hypothetical protein CES88_05940 [Halobacteriovorax sp. JY17]
MNEVFLKSIQKIQESLKSTGFLRGRTFENYKGNYFCDCSSLFTSILKIENAELFERISRGDETLKSSDYFSYAREHNLFVDEISKLKLGDILCWKKDHIPKSGDSGHMALVISFPAREEDHLYKVRVFDATKTPHSNDSREEDGVGEGDLYLQTDAIGKIIGVRWSDQIQKIKRTPIIAIRL